MKTEIVNKARGKYRWERSEGWFEERGELDTFEEGDAVCIDPFGEPYSYPIYATFVEYVTDEIAKVDIPPAEDNNNWHWFNEPAGEYLIHEGYLIPQ